MKKGQKEFLYNSSKIFKNTNNSEIIITSNLLAKANILLFLKYNYEELQIMYENIRV